MCFAFVRLFVHLLQDPEFQPDLVASKSNAAAGLCSWVLNIVKFYEVYCEVEPKRQALSKANAELAAAQEKLGAIKSKINVSHRIGPAIQEMKSLFAICQVLYLFQQKVILISQIQRIYSVKLYYHFIKERSYYTFKSCSCFLVISLTQKRTNTNTKEDLRTLLVG